MRFHHYQFIPNPVRGENKLLFGAPIKGQPSVMFLYKGEEPELPAREALITYFISVRPCRTRPSFVIVLGYICPESRWEGKEPYAEVYFDRDRERVVLTVKEEVVHKLVEIALCYPRFAMLHVCPK